ncbi:MAG TPA: alpha/beta hydrolase [Alphaproteobacteria bacterium]|nr:alpha/beta hydrolase [Alphaproteobacteria bacterium]
MSRPPAYLGYDQAALDLQYDNRAAVPDAPRYIARYGAQAAAAHRDIPGPRGLAYGTHAEQCLDVFLPARHAMPAPVAIFVHGGQWQSLTRREGAFAATTLTDAGAIYVALGFRRIPDFDLATMVDDVGAGLAWVKVNAGAFGGDPTRLCVLAHSSGAHLAAMALSGGLAVAGAVLASGLYDLAPVARTFRQRYLKLDAAGIEALSPLRHVAGVRTKLVVAVGGDESDEFKRQSSAYVDALHAAGKRARLLTLPGRHHFAACQAFAEANSPLVEASTHLFGLRR